MILKPRILRFFFSTLFSSPKVLKKCDISWCFIPKFLTSRKQFDLFDPYSLLSDSFLKGQHRHLVPDYNIMESNGKCCRILAKNLCISKIDNIVPFRSEEHTSELQSRFDLVCRLLLEKKKQKKYDR